MSPTPSDAFRALFGSETRAKLLGLLADAREPQTGYAMAKKIGVNPSKVYRQLPGLVEAGILKVREDASGYKRYVLADEDLRRFLLRRVRVTSAEEWFSPERVQEKREAFAHQREMEVPLPETRPDREAVSIPEEFERPREKERTVRRLRR